MQKDKELRSGLDETVTSNGLLITKPKPDLKLDQEELQEKQEIQEKPELQDKLEIQIAQSHLRNNHFHNECLKFKG